MKIAMVGSGYVGLVSAACFAHIGNRVYCVDRSEARIAALKKGQVPVYEPGLEALIRENTQHATLSFHHNLAEVIDKVELVFIAVGTPLGRKVRNERKKNKRRRK